MTVAEPQTKQQPDSFVQLSFSQRLVPKKGGSISISDLQQRLQNLHNELKRMEQETVNVNSLNIVSRELVSATLVQHKDKGVRSLVACCLADVLRLYAPEAPYNENELCEIFALFVNQLKNIGDTFNPYYSSNLYLLESLSTVKSVVLMVDLDNANELIEMVFTDFFDTVRENHLRQVKTHMLDVLVQIIEEAPTIQHECIHLIFDQLCKKRHRDAPAAYELAADLIRATKDRIQLYASQYFSDMILSREGEVSSDANLGTAHEIILNLFEVCPEVLLSVIPQIVEELKVEHVHLRTLATSVLGQMMAGKDGQIIKQYPLGWSTWLLKRNDRSVEVRLAWLHQIKEILLHRPEQVQEIIEMLTEKLVDPEEAIRALVIDIVRFFVLSENKSNRSLISQALLKQIGVRVKDKKQSVRKLAITTLSQLYNSVFGNIFTAESDTFSKYDWIPSSLILAMYTEDAEIILEVEDALMSLILPISTDMEQRTFRLLTVLISLTERAQTAFVNSLSRSYFVRQGLRNLISGKSDEKLVSSQLCRGFPNPTVFLQSLDKLIQSMKTDKQLSAALSVIIATDKSYVETLKNRKEVMKRIEKKLTKDELSCMKAFIYRLTPSLIHSECVPVMLNYMSEREDDDIDDKMRLCASQYLQEIARSAPDLILPNLDRIIKSYVEGNSCEKELLGVLKRTSANYSLSKSFLEKLLRNLTSNDLKTIKWSMQILCRIDGMKKDVMKQISKMTGPLLLELQPRSHLIPLATVFQCKPEWIASGPDSKAMDVILEQCLQSLTSSPRTESDENDSWIEDDSISSFCLDKMSMITFALGYLKYCTNDSTKNSKIMDCITQIVENEGNCSSDPALNSSDLVRLRLFAGMELLKACKDKNVEQLVSTGHYQKLVFLLQDPVYEVREKYSAKLMTYLGRCAIHVRYLAFLMLFAHEPEDDLRSKIRLFLQKFAAKMKKQNSGSYIFEQVSVRLLHLLSHHPDFSNDVEGLNYCKKYLLFYLDIVANQDNVSFIYHVVARLKTVQDVLGDSTNLYVMSDLMQSVIHEFCKHKSWPLTTYPGKMDLPAHLFVKLSANEAKRIFSQNFLNSQFVSQHSHRKPVLTDPVLEDAGGIEMPPMEKTKATASDGRKRKTRSQKESTDSGEDSSDVGDEKEFEPVVLKRTTVAVKTKKRT